MQLLKLEERKMPRCYLCKNNFLSINGLLSHMKYIHCLNSSSYFMCGENKCSRSFNKLASFRSHLKFSHKLVLQAKPDVRFHCDQSHSCEPTCSSSSSGGLGVVDLKTTETEEHFPLENVQLKNMSLEEYHKMFKTEIASFLANLYGKPSLTRGHVQSLTEDINSIFSSGFLCCMEEKVVSTLMNCHADEVDIQHIQSLFEILKDPFHNMSSEYMRFQHFESSGCYIPPEEYCVGSRQTSTSHTAGNLSNVKCTAQFIPLRKVLKCFLEMTNVFEKIQSYMTSLNSMSDGILSNFVQGKLWQHISSKFVDGVVFPLFIYFDDYETGNVLGSHSGVHKLGALYANLPCLPPEFQSKLDNIFLLSLFHSQDRTEFGNSVCFRPAIEELLYLENEGIVITLPEGNKRIYFALSLVLGDNLGVHSVLGFIESFSANYSCRFCKASKLQSRVMVQEDNLLLRTQEMYDNDLKIGNPSVTGIREECVWNAVPSFHVIHNQSVDIMHDIFEGVCMYSMSEILYCLICEYKLFSIDTFNSRVQLFNFSPMDGNPPPSILQDKLVTKKWSMSASEMLCLTRVFGLVIGDLIPRENPVWQLYIILMQIIDIITAQSIQNNCCVLLDVLIKEHHQLYMKLFGVSLKPKHHHALHYGRIMNQVGPLRWVWSMRYESKHRESKLSANVCNSRRNISYTLAVKHQLRLCSIFLQNKGFLSEIEISSGTEIYLPDLSHYDSFEPTIQSSVPQNLMLVNYVIVNRFKYFPKVMMRVSYEEHCPCFVQIVQVLVDENRNIYFICCDYTTLGFDDHYCAYEVSKLEQWRCLKYSDLNDIHPQWKYMAANGCTYVQLR